MAKRNPNYTREETILVLDLYFSVDVKKINENSEDIIDLSNTLRMMTIHPLENRLENFRNPNGVAMKVLGFASIDPNANGKGVDAVSKLDIAVFNEFAHDLPKLRETANAIRSRYNL